MNLLRIWYFRFRIRFLIGLWLRLKYFLSKQVTVIFSSFYVLFTVLIAGFLWKSLPNTPLDVHLESFLLALGTLLGGILAVIFSVRMILIQNAISGVVSGLFSIATKDRITLGIFIGIALVTMSCFVLVLALPLLPDYVKNPAANKALAIAFALFVTIMWLVWLLYQRIATSSDSSIILRRIDSVLVKMLKQIERRSILYSSALHATSKETEYDPRIIARITAFKFLKAESQEILTRIDLLFQYYDRVVESQDQSMAKDIITLITQTLTQYIVICKTSLSCEPSNVPLVNKSSADWFVGPILDGFLSRGKNCIRRNDDEGVTHLLGQFNHLCLVSSGIKHHPIEYNDNPLFSKFRGYLDTLVKFGVSQAHVETLFQGAKVYYNVGLYAINSKQSDQLIAIYEQLQLLSNAGIVLKSDPIVFEAITSLTSLISAIISERYYDLSVQLSMSFKRLQSAIVSVVIHSKAGIVERGIYGDEILNKVFRQTTKQLLNLIESFSEAPNERDRNKIFHMIITVVEKYIIFMRSIAEGITSADDLIILPITKSISRICSSLTNLLELLTDTSHQKSINDKITWLIHLPAWFLHHSENTKIHSVNHYLIEPIAIMGIKFSQEKCFNLSSEVIKSIISMSEQLLKVQQGSMGFDEPNSMANACLVAMVAKKNGHATVYADFREKFQTFEKNYTKKYFPNDEDIHQRLSPNRLQLLNVLESVKTEAANWMGSGEFRLSPTPRSLALDVLTCHDIDEFCKEIWPSLNKGFEK